jgi:wobble nucleotide-excising tRNase
VLQQLFDRHAADLAAHGIREPELWLKTGFHYLDSRQAAGESHSCPFCSRDLPNALQIITAYTSMFNVEFNALAERLNGLLTNLTELNLDVISQVAISIGTANSRMITSWATHLPTSVLAPLTDLIPDAQQLKELLNAVIAVVRVKAQNPATTVNLTSINELQAEFNIINLNVEQHNHTVTVYNQAIQAFRSSIQTVTQAQENLSVLKRTKSRFELPILDLCNQIRAEKQNLRVLETAYSALSQQQQQAAQMFFVTYKDKINYYLEAVFKTAFRIDSVVHVPPAGRANYNKINYRLTMEGFDISFDQTQENNTKDCLSEGDKSTIALAFFLSKLDIDPNKADKILIFDDALSSFDSNRRYYTVELIRNLVNEIRQVVVLSHNEYFLHEIFKKISGDKKTLRINQDYTANSAFIQEFDLEKHVENTYYKHLKELAAFLTAPDITRKNDVLALLRNVLEANIRFKFYRQLSTLPAQQQTFGNIINKLSSTGVNFRDTQRQQVIDKLNLLNGISCGPHHGEPIPDYTALGVDPVTITITELCAFITDTLDLIDNRL